jgi:hypothetical protein
VVQPRPGPEVAAAEAQPETRATWWRDPLSLVLGLVVLSALPIILSRVLSFESTAPYTADGFGSSNLPWVLAVVVPLALGAVLLALRKQLAWAVPPASGLILGAGLVLTETSAFWAAFFVEQSDSYDPGPALFSLFAGWAVIGAAAVVIMTRTPLGTRAAIVNDWRIVWALVVLACVVVSMVTLSEAETPWVWIENNSGPVVVGLAALPLTLLVLRTDQAVAGLVAVTVLAFWLLYYLVRDYVQQLTGIEPGTRMTEIVCLLLAVAVCYLAQVRALRGPAATEPAPR